MSISIGTRTRFVNVFNHLVRPPRVVHSTRLFTGTVGLFKMNSLQQQSESRMYSKHIVIGFVRDRPCVRNISSI
jgi:hypothetical protein